MIFECSVYRHIGDEQIHRRENKSRTGAGVHVGSYVCSANEHRPHNEQRP